MEQLCFRQRLCVVTLVFTFWIGLYYGKVLQLYYIVTFGILLEITVLKSIAEEPSVGETPVQLYYIIL